MREKVNREIEQGYESRYAWVMVTIAFIFLEIGFGALITISIFLKPLVLEFGWSRGDTSFAYTVGAGASGLGGIVMGWMAVLCSEKSPIILAVSARIYWLPCLKPSLSSGAANSTLQLLFISLPRSLVWASAG